MKKRLFYAAAVIWALCTMLTAFAAGSAKIVEAHISGEEIIAYVKGVGAAGSAQAAIGQESVEGVVCHPFSEAGLPLKTLLLIDNSLSIPKESRPAIRDALVDLVAARMDNETFAVGTISEDVHILQDFTSDYTTLKNTLDNLTYENQETYLTDALYDYLNASPFAEAENALIRILVVSDGVDNKSLGYTKDELLTLLKGTPLPIYTLGVPNNTSGNDEELENMFAIARATGGETCLLEQSGDGALSQLLADAGEYVAATVPIPAKIRDGSQQTLTLTFPSDEGSVSVSIDQLRMPLEVKTEPEPEPPPDLEPVTPVPSEPEPEEKDSLLPVILIVVLVVLAAAAAMAIIVSQKKKASFETLSREKELDARFRAQQREDETTQYTGNNQVPADDDGSTMYVWGNSPRVHSVVLTDVKTPDRRYQKPIDTSLIIGFAAQSDICVNYDKSVSRKHCEIIREGENYYLVNHSQSNGTQLNNMSVTGKTPISSGDVIQMGRVSLRVEFNQ